MSSCLPALMAKPHLVKGTTRYWKSYSWGLVAMNHDLRRAINHGVCFKTKKQYSNHKRKVDPIYCSLSCGGLEGPCVINPKSTY